MDGKYWIIKATDGNLYMVLFCGGKSETFLYEGSMFNQSMFKQ